MRTVLFAAVLLLTAVSVSANPVWNDEVVLEFEDGGNCSWPYVGQPIKVRVVLTEPVFAQEGISAFSFRVERTFSAMLTSETNLMGPPDFFLGSAEIDGMTCPASPDCATPDSHGRIPVAELEYVFTGTPGTLTVLGHSTEGMAFVDCGLSQQWWNTYGERNVAGFGMEPPGGCHSASSVEDLSWGAIKALYH